MIVTGSLYHNFGTCTTRQQIRVELDQVGVEVRHMLVSINELFLLLHHRVVLFEKSFRYVSVEIVQALPVVVLLEDRDHCDPRRGTAVTEFLGEPSTSLSLYVM